MIRDMMSRYIAIYLAISHTPDHLETPGTKPNSTKTHHLVAVYSSFFRLCICPRLGCVRLDFLSFFCCPSAGHIVGLTLSPANSNLVPSGLGLLPECMHVCFCFIALFFFLSIFPCPNSFFVLYLVLIPDTPYSSFELYLIYYYCC